MGQSGERQFVKQTARRCPSGRQRKVKTGEVMITLTKLNGEKFVLNCDMIEIITENPDTTILLTNGKHLLVREKKEQVVNEVVEFKRSTFRELLDRIK